VPIQTSRNTLPAAEIATMTIIATATRHGGT
jgi:hypothetical protein